MAVQLGWLDTNVFVHVLYPGDREHQRCRALVEALEDDRAQGWLSFAVMHELTYTLSRKPGFGTRTAIAIYVNSILSYPGVLADDKDVLVNTVARWAASTTIALVDAYLAVLAERDGMPVCSANARDFPATPNSYATAPL
jgi:predicted nucleic acid-binding protein